MVKLLLLYVLTICCFLNFYGQEVIYNYPGIEHNVGTKCQYFHTKEDFIQNKNGDSAILEIHYISELTFDVKTFYDKPKRKEINAMYCIITKQDTLFNLRKYELGHGYTKRIIMDSFHILFKSKNENNYFAQYGLLGAALGGALSSSMRINLAQHFTMAVNQNTGEVIDITKPYLKYKLKKFKDEKILDDFKDEKEYTLDIMLKYFKYLMANKDKFESK
jgi:hypothetical protein